MVWGQSPPKPMRDISNRSWHFSHQTLKKPQNPTPQAAANNWYSTSHKAGTQPICHKTAFDKKLRHHGLRHQGSPHKTFGALR